jgi:hypothetical protein
MSHAGDRWFQNRTHTECDYGTRRGIRESPVLPLATVINNRNIDTTKFGNSTSVSKCKSSGRSTKQTHSYLRITFKTVLFLRRLSMYIKYCYNFKNVNAVYESKTVRYETNLQDTEKVKVTCIRNPASWNDSCLGIYYSITWILYIVDIFHYIIIIITYVCQNILAFTVLLFLIP